MAKVIQTGQTINLKNTSSSIQDGHHYYK